MKTKHPAILFGLSLCINGLLCTSTSREAKTVTLAQGVYATLDAPVVVSTSQVNEKRWGYHQFVSISPYPEGKILLRYHVGADAVKAYGMASPTFISADLGTSWQPFAAEGLPANGLSCPLFDGHYLCLPSAVPINIKHADLTLPNPLAKVFSYTGYYFYRLADCPVPIKDFFVNMTAVRWSPESKRWQPDMVRYDSTDALIWTLAESEESPLVARTTFERPPLLVGNELLYADYRTNYLLADGAVPPHWSVSCMVSNDNGRSWRRRSTIAVDEQGIHPMTEPMLAQTKNGELVCVLRRSDHRQVSMMITFSQDRGETWEKPVSLDRLGHFGVMPCLTPLECGVLALTYGRPGIWLTFSLDGTGREWTDPVCLLKSDPHNREASTDGYTSMLPIGSNQLLLAYCDFQYKDEQGNQRKAVLVRKITIHGIKAHP
ncbi:MAG TPA: sialidase family protein [bacterium]|nr:sialidase family protein [bacterium]HPN33760.1 sialidase family protein [bacterium]